MTGSFAFVIAAFAFLGLAMAGPVQVNRLSSAPGCGHQLNPRYMRPFNESEFANIRRDAPMQPPGAKIRVHWMAVMQNDSLPGGNIPDSLIEESITLLNSDFEETGFEFELTKIDRIVDPTLFKTKHSRTKHSGGAPEALLKKTIPIQDITLLKIWSLWPEDGLSFSRFPDEYAKTPELDGVMYGVESLQRGKPVHLLAHEVGHWTGLYHTFQGGCETEGGDRVDDTPPHLDPTKLASSFSKCESPVSSCGNGQIDPTDNFMNYQNDECRKRFTPGQIDRMHVIMEQYRGLLPSPPAPPPLELVPTPVIHVSPTTTTLQYPLQLLSVPTPLAAVLQNRAANGDADLGEMYSNLMQLQIQLRQLDQLDNDGTDTKFEGPDKSGDSPPNVPIRRFNSRISRRTPPKAQIKRTHPDKSPLSGTFVSFPFLVDDLLTSEDTNGNEGTPLSPRSASTIETGGDADPVGEILGSESVGVTISRRRNVMARRDRVKSRLMPD